VALSGSDLMNGTDRRMNVDVDQICFGSGAMNGTDRLALSELSGKRAEL
jgi:hypothetical protein